MKLNRISTPFIKKVGLCVALLVSPTLSLAAGEASAWSLSSQDSKVSYGSIKKNSVGEVNYFKSASGSISATGEVSVAIDLASVETNIGIRNERMIKHVFGEKAAQALLQTTIDVTALNNLAVGAMTTIDVEGTLTFLGKAIEIDTAMVVVRLSSSRLMVMSDDMIMVKTGALGVETGIDKLMELAKLPGITRVVPVTLRMVFDKAAKTAAKPSASTTQDKVAAISSPVAGDAKLGKKVFRQCQACHNVKSEEHSVGPHLFNIIGRKAGSVEGYAASDAIKKSGVVWSEQSLTAFLTNPSKAIPNNQMPFAGLSNSDDTKNLIAYLQKYSQ